MSGVLRTVTSLLTQFYYIDFTNLIVKNKLIGIILCHRDYYFFDLDAKLSVLKLITPLPPVRATVGEQARRSIGDSNGEVAAGGRFYGRESGHGARSGGEKSDTKRGDDDGR